MLRSIAISFVALTFVAAAQSEVLKCYMCTSLTNASCGFDLAPHLLQPVECNGNEMVKWQRSIKQHKVLNTIARLFEVDETVQHYQVIPQDMACAKMILNIQNQEVVIRTCQTAKTETIDPCKTMGMKLEGNPFVKMEQCALCLKEACNGTMMMSPQIFYIILLFLGTLINVTFYNLA